MDLDDATIEANRTEAEAHAQEILDALVAGDKDKAAELAETYGATDDSWPVLKTAAMPTG